MVVALTVWGRFSASIPAGPFGEGSSFDTGLVMNWKPLHLALVPLFVLATLSFQPARGQVATYAVELVATASTGVDINDAGHVIGSSYVDTGCGSSCLPPLETVVWIGDRRVVLPTVPGLDGITVTGINNHGWITGYAGFNPHAVVWKPEGSPANPVYRAIDLGNLPGRPISTAAGIDDLGRVVGWSTTSSFPANGAPFVWTESGGMVDLAALGFPNEWPLGISPGGTVATFGFWYRLGEPGSVNAMPAPPASFSLENSRVAINDAGDQARFLVTGVHPYLDYPFRYHHKGGWQQISSVPTGHLSSYRIGSINDAGDVTATVASTGMIAFGPSGLAQPLAPLVSSAYGGGYVTFAGPLNDSGEILAGILIGRSTRLVRLIPAQPCTANCTRVSSIQMVGEGPAYCNQGQNEVQTTVRVTGESGLGVSGATVTGHFFDDYWLDQPFVGSTNATGHVLFTHVGPACVGAVAFLVTDVSTSARRTFDRTTGILSAYVIPLPLAPFEAGSGLAGETTLSGGLERVHPNPVRTEGILRFTLPEAAEVRLAVYNSLGREVALVVDGTMEAGTHDVSFEASGLHSGVYFARFTTGNGVTQTQTVIVVR